MNNCTLCEVVEAGNILDLLHLDDMNIRGWQIWVGYKDHCGGDLVKFRDAFRLRDSSMVERINREAKLMKVPERAVTGGWSSHGGSHDNP